jgi:hypothetical protein
VVVTAKDTPPPGYVAYRGVLIGLVIAAFVVVGIVVGLWVPAAWQWIVVTQQQLHVIWFTWQWHLT